MNTNDLMSTLREADPAERIDLARLGDDDFADLRRGVLAADRPQASAAKPRRVRRSVLAGGLSLALIGGGAYAYASRDMWGAQDADLNCLASWAEIKSDEDLSIRQGPMFSDDPIADCQYYAKQSGVEPIKDPVALWYTTSIVVGPREGSPNAPSVGPRSPKSKALNELEHSLGDWVDGGSAECMSGSAAMAFAKQEVARLGLDDVEVVLDPDDSPGRQTGPCALLFVGSASAGGPDDTVLVRPNFEADFTEKPDPNDKESLATIRDGLRKQVADQCLSLGDAEKVAKKVLGSRALSPISVTQDDSADCTRIDMVVGGGIDVYLYGPKVAKP